MNYYKLLFVYVVLLLSACSSEEISTYHSKNETSLKSSESELVLKETLNKLAMSFPKGTSLKRDVESRLEIKLPAPNMFLVENEDGTIELFADICYVCECTKSAPESGSIQDCNVTYGTGGFGCVHFENCGTCSGRFEKCDRKEGDGGILLVGIISLDSNPIKPIVDVKQFEELGTFNFSDEKQMKKVFQFLKKKFKIESIEQSLFNKEYFSLNSTSKRSEIMLVSFCGNKIGLEVDSSWKENIKSKFDSDNVMTIINYEDLKVSCECVINNPFGVLHSDETCHLSYSHGLLVCVSRCPNGCRMRITE